MAGDWIKMGKDLLTHPKVVRISSASHADRLRTVGGLFAVWCLFDTHSADGRLVGYTRDAIDEHVNFPGFASAMESVGWIFFDEEGAELPDFEEHNGQSAKRRAQEVERKRNDRKTSASHADNSRTVCGQKADQRREEKRREESSSLRSEEDARAPRAPSASGLVTLQELVEQGVNAQHASDWLKVRAKQRAPLTRTAWDGIVKEAAKAGVTLNDAVRIMAERSWRGLQAAWLSDLASGNTQARAQHKNAKHAGFEEKDYTAGVMEDGTIV